MYFNVTEHEWVRNGSPFAPIHDVYEQNGYITIHSDDVCCKLAGEGTLTWIKTHRSGGGLPAQYTLHPDALCEAPSRCTIPTNHLWSECHNGAPDVMHTYSFIRDVLATNPDCDAFITLNINQEHVPTLTNAPQVMEWMVSFLQFVLTPTTALFLTSDHGLHFGPHMETTAGFAYNKNPALLIFWPTAWSKEMATALARNQNQLLTTHHNTYSTLHEIATGIPNARSLTNNNLVSYKSCEEALIGSWFCICILSTNCTSEQTAQIIPMFKAEWDMYPHLEALCDPIEFKSAIVSGCYGNEKHHIGFVSIGGTSKYRVYWYNGATHGNVKQTTPYEHKVRPCRQKLLSVVDSSHQFNICTCKSDH
jgi:hypothetical protein